MNKKYEHNSKEEKDYVLLDILALGEITNPDKGFSILFKERTGNRIYPLLVEPRYKELVKYSLKVENQYSEQNSTMIDCLLDHVFARVIEVRLTPDSVYYHYSKALIEFGLQFDVEPVEVNMPLVESLIFALRRNVPIRIHNKILDDYKALISYENDQIFIKNKRFNSIVDKKRRYKAKRLFNARFGTMASSLKDEWLGKLKILDVLMLKYSSDEEGEPKNIEDLLCMADQDDLEEALDAFVEEENYEWAAVIYSVLNNR